MHYHSKQILVLGLGRSGLAATRLLQQAGASVTVADSGGGEALQQHAEALRAEGVSVHLGEKALSFLQSSAFSLQPLYDRAILSPGIEPTSPLVQQVVACRVPLVGELELAYDFCKCPIVAITGTNGKTTTTELTVAGLLGAGLKTIACGNIGLPFSEAVVKSAELDVIVIEVSSFQLETTDRFHAHVAVWLNLSPNHLDRYASVVEYREAKLRIFRNQDSNDVVIIPMQRGQSQKLQNLGSDPKIHRLAPDSAISGTDPFADPFALDALFLARAGLERLGFDLGIVNNEGRFLFEGRELFVTELTDLLPAPGQGAIAIETRAENNDPEFEQALKKIHHEETALCVEAERLLLRYLGGGCHMALGALTTIDPASQQLQLRATYVPFPLAKLREGEATGTTPEEVARRVATQLGEKLAVI